MRFVREKMKTKNTPKLPTHRENTEKQLFDIGFLFMGLFGFFFLNPFRRGGLASQCNKTISLHHATKHEIKVYKGS